MKWNVYHPTTIFPFAMILLLSCQSKVQEDNTAYERFKQKKMHEKDSVSIQTNPVAEGKETPDTSSLITTNQRKTSSVTTAIAKVSRTTPGIESDAVRDYEPSSAEIPKIQKATVVKSFTPEDNSHKKGIKQKKLIEWPKINKINLKKKKKQKGAEEVG